METTNVETTMDIFYSSLTKDEQSIVMTLAIKKAMSGKITSRDVEIVFLRKRGIKNEIEDSNERNKQLELFIKRFDEFLVS